MDELAGMVAFARVVEAHSFAGAARRLRLSRPVVSKRVSALEKRLGARLLHRTTRRLSLTETGAALYPHCARIAEEAEAAQLAAQHLHAEPRGTLRVSLPGAFGQLHVVPTIPAFLARYPEVTVECRVEERLADLAEEGLDLAIRLTHAPAENLVARRLAPLRWVVCAAPSYLANHPTPRAPGDLADHACLFYGSEPGAHTWRFTRDGERAAVTVDGRFRIDNTLALREVALAGSGIALLPSFTAGPELESGRLRPLLGDWEPAGTFGNAVYAVYLSNRHLSPKVRALVDHLADHFGDPPYWDGRG